MTSLWCVVEAVSIARTGELSSCEDVVVDLPGFCGVIDATSGQEGLPLTPGPISFGRAIALTLAETLAKLDRRVDAADFVHAATLAVRALKQSRGSASHRSTGGAFFCIAAMERAELWRLGDCWFAIDDRLNQPTLAVEQPFTSFRSALLNALLLRGATVAELQERKADAEILARYLGFKDEFANDTRSEYGFGVINGDDVPESFIERHAISRDARRVAMGTDGFVKGAMDLPTAQQRLADILAIDPLLIGENKAPRGLSPGCSAHDDRSFVLIERRAATAS